MSKWKTPKDYERSISGRTDKIEQLRQFHIRLDRLIRTDRWINRGFPTN